ncbi:hypothetical protein [Pseudomonas sp. BN414]|uniref:hypothetical protein n=1 Tax=Pseudomonas sp. BN414 TaxID=2567888 RepID=UPI002453F391|nr:hypothetical protein [Pseudomonas sp. BN414]
MEEDIKEGDKNCLWGRLNESDGYASDYNAFFDGNLQNGRLITKETPTVSALDS